jgi:hypothetical protein
MKSGTPEGLVVLVMNISATNTVPMSADERQDPENNQGI